MHFGGFFPDRSLEPLYGAVQSIHAPRYDLTSIFKQYACFVASRSVTVNGKPQKTGLCLKSARLFRMRMFLCKETIFVRGYFLLEKRKDLCHIYSHE